MDASEALILLMIEHKTADSVEDWREQVTARLVTLYQTAGKIESEWVVTGFAAAAAVAVCETA